MAKCLMSLNRTFATWSAAAPAIIRLTFQGPQMSGLPRPHATTSPATSQNQAAGIRRQTRRVQKATTTPSRVRASPHCSRRGRRSRVITKPEMTKNRSTPTPPWKWAKNALPHSHGSRFGMCWTRTSRTATARSTSMSSIRPRAGGAATGIGPRSAADGRPVGPRGRSACMMEDLLLPRIATVESLPAAVGTMKPTQASGIARGRPPARQLAQPSRVACRSHSATSIAPRRRGGDGRGRLRHMVAALLEGRMGP